MLEISNEIYKTSTRFWLFFSFKCKKKPIPDKVITMVSHSLMIVGGQSPLMTFSNPFTRIIRSV